MNTIVIYLLDKNDLFWLALIHYMVLTGGLFLLSWILALVECDNKRISGLSKCSRITFKGFFIAGILLILLPSKETLSKMIKQTNGELILDSMSFNAIPADELSKLDTKGGE